MKKILIDILTGIDGKTFDEGRVLGFVTVLTFLLLSGLDVYFTHTFEYEHFGLGISTIFAGIGINLKLKENTEPKNNV